MIKDNIEKIVQKGNDEDMQKLSDILEKSLDRMQDLEPDKYNEYNMCIYELANGKILTDEMKREWVRNMKPLAKWTEEDVANVVGQYDIKIPITSCYLILNMLYSDMKSAFGSGDNEESLKRYINGMNDWYFDEDAKNTKEAKIYNYWKYIVN